MQSLTSMMAWSDEWRCARLQMYLRDKELFQGEAVNVQVRADIRPVSSSSKTPTPKNIISSSKQRWSDHCEGAQVQVQIVDVSRKDPHASSFSSSFTTLFRQESQLQVSYDDLDERAFVVALKTQFKPKIRHEFWGRELLLIVHITPKSSIVKAPGVGENTGQLEQLSRTTPVLQDDWATSQLLSLTRKQAEPIPELTRRVEQRINIIKALHFEVERRELPGRRVGILARAFNVHLTKTLAVRSLYLHLDEVPQHNESDRGDISRFRIVSGDQVPFPVVLHPQECYNFLYVLESVEDSKPFELLEGSQFKLSDKQATSTTLKKFKQLNSFPQHALLTLSWQAHGIFMDAITEHRAIVFSIMRSISSLSIDDKSWQGDTQKLIAQLLAGNSTRELDPPAVFKFVRVLQHSELKVQVAPLSSAISVGTPTNFRATISNRSARVNLDLTLVLPIQDEIGTAGHGSTIVGFETSHRLGLICPGMSVNRSLHVAFLRPGKCRFGPLVLVDHLTHTCFVSDDWEVYSVEGTGFIRRSSGFHRAVYSREFILNHGCKKMARLASKKLLANAYLIADDSDDDERKSWLYRSTLGTDEEVVDTGTNVCTWSQLHTPIPSSVKNMENGEVVARKEPREVVFPIGAEEARRNRSGKSTLPLLIGFSNTEALKAQLPRSTSDKWQRALDSSTVQKTRNNDASFQQKAWSREKMPAHHRDWKLERNLQDDERTISAKKALGVSNREHNVLCDHNPGAFTANLNQRKPERQLHDSAVSTMSASLTSGFDQRWYLKRKLERLIAFARRRPTEADVEGLQCEWNLGQRRPSLHIMNTLSTEATKPELTCTSANKLPALKSHTMIITPTALTIAEKEKHQCKWDLDGMPHDATSACNEEYGHKTKSQRAVAGGGMNQFVDSMEARRRIWDIDSKLQWDDFHVKNTSKRQLSVTHDLPTYKQPVLTEISMDANKAECELHHMKKRNKRRQIIGSDMSMNDFDISLSLAYCLLFLSTAVLHSAILNFSFKLRQYFRLDSHPIGTLLLLSWVYVGFIHFVGGLLGDLVRDRVLLLRRIAVLWSFAVIMLHIATFRFSLLVSSISLVAGFIFASVAHGIMCPNVIALVLDTNLCFYHVASKPLMAKFDRVDSIDDKDRAPNFVPYSLAVSTFSSGELQQRNDFDSHSFLTGCFSAKLAGSVLVQGYFYLYMNVSALNDKDSETHAVSHGFYCMLLVSFGLMASLIYFCFISWDFSEFEEHTFNSNFVNSEQKLSTSAKVALTWSWTGIFRLRCCALTNNALISFLLVVLMGGAFALILKIVRSQMSLLVRLVAFLIVVIGWLLTFVASSQQLKRAKRQLFSGNQMEVRERQVYVARLAVALICVTSCVAYLRAQVYTTMVIQICQTRLLIPGTANSLFNPELLGTAVGTSSLAFLGLSHALQRNIIALKYRCPNRFVLDTPVSASSVVQTTARQHNLRSPFATHPPATRMCVAMLLYLICVFLSSVVELYRRQTGEWPSKTPRICGATHSDFTFLWTLPNIVLIGASDALFRVSLQELCHEIVRETVAPLTSLPSTYRWNGAVQGVISLAEMLGYVTALILVAVLSHWLLHPQPKDMTLFFLLLTTMVALTHAILNRIVTRA
ncbi:putative MFS transporter superfamily [Plasmopara halstedii]